jgi:hypothetical protein
MLNLNRVFISCRSWAGHSVLLTPIDLIILKLMGRDHMGESNDYGIMLETKEEEYQSS